jgi:LPXTG-site transpeptidase (sortase) family protein
MRRCGAALVVLVLLPLAGCAGEAARPVAPPRTSGTQAPAPPRLRPSAVSRAPRPAATPEPRQVVPTVPATLGPVAEEASVPRRFVAGAIDVDLPVIPVGVDPAGSMELPETVGEVAWYQFGARPGDTSGSAVLAGHVDTVRDGLGPFARLRELDEGDEIAVELGGSMRRYRVSAVEKVPKSEVPLDRVFRLDGPPELKVITCGGSFSRRSGYRDNVIVTAVPR